MSGDRPNNRVIGNRSGRVTPAALCEPPTPAFVYLLATGGGLHQQELIQMTYYLFGNCIYTNAPSLKRLAKVSPRDAVKVARPDGLSDGQPFFVVQYADGIEDHETPDLCLADEIDSLMASYLRAGLVESMRMMVFNEGRYVPAR